DQFALRAVAGNDVVWVVFAAFERRLAVVESEARFRFLRPVTTEADRFENRFHVAVEVNRRFGGGGQNAGVYPGAAQVRSGRRQQRRQEKTATDRGATVHRLIIL